MRLFSLVHEQQQHQQRGHTPTHTRSHTHTRTRRALSPAPGRPRAHASETTVPSAGVSASSTVPSVMMTLSKRNHPR